MSSYVQNWNPNNASRVNVKRWGAAFLFLAMVALTPHVANAVIAHPLPVEVKQPDGTKVRVHVRGDEFVHWFEDMDGYSIVLDNGTYVYAELGKGGELVPTKSIVGKTQPAAIGLSKNITPSIDYANQQRARMFPKSIAKGINPNSANAVQTVLPVGNVKNLVILCKFADHQEGVHTHPPQDYDSILNGTGSSILAPSGTVKDFYKENSYGIMTLNSTVIAWVTLPQSEDYYTDGNYGFGLYPRNAQGMVEDALKAADAVVDFSQFDTDNDGFVDAIDIIHSGYGGEYGRPDRIWSHRWSLGDLPGGLWQSGDRNANGVNVKVFDYHTEPGLTGVAGNEITPIDVICHETGHFFGLPDLYDTDQSSEGIGSYCLMANSWGFDGTGNHPPQFSAWCKLQLQWITPAAVSLGVNPAPAVEKTPLIYKIDGGFPAGEYLLVENRQPLTFESDMPQGGLCIWHIDEKMGTTNNKDNNQEGYPGQAGWPANNKHYRVALLQADGLYEMERGLNRGNQGDVYHGTGVSSISPNTVPNTHAYQGGLIVPTGINIFNISASGNNMTFTYAGPTGSGGGGGGNQVVQFISAEYLVDESSPGFATITVTNIGGKAGTVDYATTNGTAINGIDYIGRTNTLSFALGESNKTFTIPIIDNANVDGERTVNLSLLNPTGGLTLGFLTNATLAITDDETVPFASQAGTFQFSSRNTTVTEFETEQGNFFSGGTYPWTSPDSVSTRSAKGALMTVVRTNGAVGRVLIDYLTVDGTAFAGIDYAATNGTLAFNDYQMSTNFVIPIFSDAVSNGNKSFSIILTNARPAPEEDSAIVIPTIGAVSNATVKILEIGEAAKTFSIERSNYRIEEYGDQRPHFASIDGDGTPFFRTNIAVDVINPGGESGVCYIDVFAARGGNYVIVGYPIQAGSDYPNYGDWSYLQPRFTDGTPDITDVSDFDLFDGADLSDPIHSRYHVANNGTLSLSFEEGQTRKRLMLAIINDNQVEFNEDIRLTLSLPSGSTHSLKNRECTVTVLFDDQPAGALDREWNADNVARTPERPFNPTPGANNNVRSVAVQPWDNKTIIGGDFTSVNTLSRGRIARFNFDGSVDTTFNPGTGANGFIDVVLLNTNQLLNPDRKILIGGGFGSFNGTQVNGVARLNSDGSLDTTFNPGNGVGIDGRIRAMAVQSDGRIVISGDFKTYNDVVRNGIARIYPDGSLDTTFDPVLGPRLDANASPDDVIGAIWSIALQNSTNGQKILIGGEFTYYNNFAANRLARLNPDGSLDFTFLAGRGANDEVFSICTLENDGILVGGAFTQMDVYRRAGIVRLSPNGQVDFSFDPGDGCNDSVYTIYPMSDGKTFIGGKFTSFNNTRRIGLAKLKVNGTLDTSFLDTAYNQFAGVIVTNNIQPRNYINAIGVQTNGDIMIGGSFHQIGGNASAAAATPNPYTQFSRADMRVRYNVARLIGGYTYGPGNIEFISTPYRVDENSGTMDITLERIDGRLGVLSGLCTTTNNLAVGTSDYGQTNRVMKWSDSSGRAMPLAVGDVGYKYFTLPILDDSVVEGDETVDLGLINTTGNIVLGGEYVPIGGSLGKAQSQLTIVDNDFNYGQFGFSAPAYTVNENGGKATITVTRTNGTDGTITVDYFTRPGQPPQATPGSSSDYIHTAGSLRFDQGVTSRTISITINDDNLVELDENISIVLTNAGGGASFPNGWRSLTNTLTIIDNDFSNGRLNFSAATYTNREDSGIATVTVTRSGGNSGILSVDYIITDGSAVKGADYFSTNGTLTWVDGDSSPKTFNINLVGPDGLIEGSETINLALTNFSIPGAFGGRTNATLVIEDSDTPGVLSFSQTAYAADENGTAANITVIRSGGIAGQLTATYGSSAGSALPGSDYSNVSGLLTFTNGQTSASFTVPVLDDQVADGDKTVNLVIATSTPGAVTNSVLTLIDNESFNTPAGSLDTTFDQNVKTDGFVYSLALQPDGRLLIGGDFVTVNDVPRTRVARLQSTGVLDPTFNAVGGPNDSVRCITLQQDGKVLLGGLFTVVNLTNRNSIVRLNSDGSVDNSFNPGSGANNAVYAITSQADDKVLVAGAFNTFSGVARARIARLNTNGTVDVTFNPGLAANAAIYAVAVQPDGKILIGGDFTTFNNVPRSYLARLNANGTLDTAFTNIINGPIRAILIQPDGRIVIGGSFTAVNGTARNYLARLNANGTFDTTFLAGGLSGANNVVYSIAQQVDGKLMVAGDFTTFNGVSRNRLTRLINDGVRDGATDPTINFGSGADNFIQSMVIQPDRKIVFAGGFSSYNDQSRKYIARIHGGSIAGPGSLEFSRPVFTVSESQTNATISVRRVGGTTTNIAVNYFTSDGVDPNGAHVGVHYQSASGTLSFPEGETRRTFNVAVLNDYLVNVDRTVNLSLTNFTNGSTSGSQGTATLSIANDDCSIGFSTPTYSVNEDVASGSGTVSLTRLGASNSVASVDFATISGGSATINADYTVTNGTVTFLPGETVKNFNVRIVDDTEIESSETVNLRLSNPQLAPSVQLTPNATNAILQLNDNDVGPGQFSFAVSNFFNSEFEASAALTVTRSNGSTGIVGVQYRTYAGTATPGVDYVETTNVLSFSENERSKTVIIPLINDSVREADEIFYVALSTPTGGATIGALSTATVTIVDDDAFVVPAGSVLTSESFTPTNNYLEPGEKVRMLFALRNAGRSVVTNLVATLLSTNGVVTTNAPVSYGRLETNGIPSAREFAFNISTNATNGQRIAAVLDLKDGSFSLGTVSFSYTLGQANATFANTNLIAINDDTTANPYPSSIMVSGVAGPITKVAVTLKNLSHSYPDDVEVLLVSPAGQKVVLMANVGGNVGIAAPGVTLTFDDSAANSLPDAASITSGNYKPTRFGFVEFPPDAPAAPYDSTLAVFNGYLANGVWKLYVRDDLNQDFGAISGGWSLAISSTDVVTPVVDLFESATVSATVSAVGQNLIYTANITNFGPSIATNVYVTGNFSSDVVLVSASANVSTNQIDSQNVKCTLNSPLTNGARATISFVVRPAIEGNLVATITAQAGGTEANPANNAVTLTTAISQAPPQLVAVRNNTSVTLSWPATAANFVLETSTNFVNWVPVSGAPGIVGSSYSYTIPFTAGTNGFYRLKSQ